MERVVRDNVPLEPNAFQNFVADAVRVMDDPINFLAPECSAFIRRFAVSGTFMAHTCADGLPLRAALELSVKDLK